MFTGHPNINQIFTPVSDVASAPAVNTAQSDADFVTPEFRLSETKSADEVTSNYIVVAFLTNNIMP